MSNVVETLKLALTAVGSPAELARALEVTPSHVSRLRKGTAGISAELSLRLSRIVGRPALQGLRDDGHAELAALLEPIFNVGDKGTILDRSLADDLACLSDAEFTLIRDLIAAVAKPSRRGPATRR